MPLIYDAEVLSVIYNVFISLGIKRFGIILNNRALLTGLLKSLGVSVGTLIPILRILDKAEKVSKEVFTKELEHYGMSPGNIKVLEHLMTQQLDNKDWLKYLPTLCTTREFMTGLQELEELMNRLQDFEVRDTCLRIDPMLTRGLTYYTGTVCEVKLLDYPQLGSVCGGGRYANLVESLSDRALPCVGFSICVSRLLPKLIETGIIQAQKETPAEVMVTSQNIQHMQYYIYVAKILRTHHINTEIYLAQKPLSLQIKYASKKGMSFVIIADHEELAREEIILRDLTKGKQMRVSLAQALAVLKHPELFQELT